MICFNITLSDIAKVKTAAAIFSTDLCTSVNVTLPNFLECTNEQSLVRSETTIFVNRTPTSSTTVAGTVKSQLPQLPQPP